MLLHYLVVRSARSSRGGGLFGIFCWSSRWKLWLEQRLMAYMAYLRHAELWVSHGHGQQKRPASAVTDEGQRWQGVAMSSPRPPARPARVQASPRGSANIAGGLATTISPSAVASVGATEETVVTARGEKKTEMLQEHINSLQKALELMQHVAMPRANMDAER
mmetsp:Transcript_100613/g.199892  ORF Transcript_100613/g.199892 Transcript_100613/m.199892 type:complete len:163 (-) Transcript_100613:171-659(-)